MTLKRLYSILLVILVAVAFKPPFFVEAFELKIYDLFMKYSAPNKPDPRITIVGIDQKSLDVYGRWPWPRNVIGDLVKKLSQFGVRVTALDISFSTQADQGIVEVMDRLGASIEREGIGEKFPDFYGEYAGIRKELSKDEALATEISEAKNVVTAFLFHSAAKKEAISEEVGLAKREQIKPARIKLVRRSQDSRDAHIWFKAGDVEPNIPLIQKAGAASGFLNTWTDPDGVIRAHPMVIEHEGEIFQSLAMASAILYQDTQRSVTAYFKDGMFFGVDTGAKMLPMNARGRIQLRYLGPDETFPIISAADVMSTPVTDEKFKAQLHDKIAFVGATATQIYDLRVTPFGITAGVEVQATAASNALTGQTIKKLGWQRIYDSILTLLVGVIIFFALKRIGVYIGLIFTLGLLVGLVWLNYWMFADNFLWLHTVTPGFTIIFGYITVNTYQYVSEQKSKRFIKDAFGRYLSPKVINLIVDNPSLLKLGGEKRMMTAFFSDVAGFTTISEKLAPSQLVALLNQYLSEMSEIIHDLDGTVDKYEGDAIIAFWGAPIPFKNHAQLCTLASVRQQRRLIELREEWRAQGKDELMVRMGINTGPMVVGNMGSKDRMDYTMMGDSVNLAARLEGANKYYGSYTMVSEFTYEQVKDFFLCRELDMVRVAGKADAIRLYEVIEELDRITEPERRFVRMFEQALATFRRMKFREAAKIFTACDKLVPGGDGACKLYLKRSAELIAAPPPDDWDRVYDLAK